MMPTGVKVDEEKKQKLIGMHTVHHVPVSTISREYGISTKTLYRWLKENNMEEEKQTTQTTEESKEQQQTPAEPQETTDATPTADEGDEDQPKDEQSDELTCPNPSCSKPFDGKKCKACGYDQSLMS